MIENSFIFLEGLKEKSEQNFWARGICTWDDILQVQKVPKMSNHRLLYYKRKVLDAQAHLYRSDSSYFISKLPRKEMWRLYSHFRGETVFLDIETCGPGKKDAITVIGLFDGISTKTMIKGINLNIKALEEELKHYKLIVTFNGSSFDLPFLNRQYPRLLPDIPHFDLLHLCNRLGLKGGLKEIERNFEIKRSPIVDRLYGGDPLLLWKMFRASGDQHFLNLLVEYNEEDCINLKIIADYATKKMEKILKERYFTKPLNSASRQAESLVLKKGPV